MGIFFAGPFLMENKPYPASERFSSGTHTSYWIDSVKPVSYEKLESNFDVDVVVVGGGISGLSVAYNLSREGKKVAVVEDGFIGSGETGRTTAHIVAALDDRYYEIERIFGKEKSRLVAQSHTKAIDFIEETMRRENIECDFKRVHGYLFLHPTDNPKNLQKEFEACLRSGLDVAMDVVRFRNSTADAIRFNNQGQFHVMKYLKGLCEAIIKQGGKIFNHTHAKEIGKDGILSAEGHRINARSVVVATNTPVNNKYVMHLRQFPYRTYVVGLKVPKGKIPTALWWDTGNYSVNSDIPPYHYVRTQPLDENNDLLLVGGEDHPTGLTEPENKPEEWRYTLLEQWAREHFDALGEKIYQWSGQCLEPTDSLAYIGHNPTDEKNIYIVTGDSGNGITHGTIAGILISDLIVGRENPLTEIYSPSRIKVLKTGNVWLKEFIGGMFEYLKHKPHVTESDPRGIEPNEARIIEHESKKVGCYRDGRGDLHFVDVACTHMGCTVKWNNDEKSWDCPCHGSRFTYEGRLLNGPANEPLPYYSEPGKNAVVQNKPIK
jgi:glycine/D-amino acid oxidase-like deaminating enzyme/nitrite reductase/ring-hydroxylating ferredoxin subunit